MSGEKQVGGGPKARHGNEGLLQAFALGGSGADSSPLFVSRRIASVELATIHLADRYATSGDPLRVLAGLTEIRDHAAVIERASVDSARKHGATWSDIGECLGISKQAAAQRFGGR